MLKPPCPERVQTRKPITTTVTTLNGGQGGQLIHLIWRRLFSCSPYYFAIFIFLHLFFGAPEIFLDCCFWTFFGFFKDFLNIFLDLFKSLFWIFLIQISAKQCKTVQNSVKQCKTVQNRLNCLGDLENFRKPNGDLKNSNQCKTVENSAKQSKQSKLP